MSVKYDLKEIEEKIFPIIKKRVNIVTPQDVAMESGLPVLYVKDAMISLASKHKASVKVSKDGKLQFKFFAYRSRESKSLLITLLQLLLFIFKESFILLFKAGWMVMLVSYSFVYMTVFLVSYVIIAIYVILSSYDRRGSFMVQRDTKAQEEIRRGAWESIGYMINMYSELFNFKSTTDRPFYQKIFSFIFGETHLQPPITPEKNGLLFVKEHKKITLADFINLNGLTEEESQKKLLQMVTKYDGEILVSEDGVVYYTFSDFEKVIPNTGSRQKYSYIWNRKKIMPTLTGNSDKDNMKIVSLALLNLLVSAILATINLDGAPFPYLDKITFWFGNVPLVYSILFFLIPLLRIPSLGLKKAKVTFENHVWYILNELAYNLKKTEIDEAPIEDKVEQFLMKRYPSYFRYDYDNKNKKVIAFERYHEELMFSSNGKPNNIEINDPDDVDFMSFDEHF
ncbi:hypothetical protein JXR93_11285 [bacterium]|nr:hypothetical protein [bacterium]